MTGLVMVGKYLPKGGEAVSSRLTKFLDHPHTIFYPLVKDLSVDRDLFHSESLSMRELIRTWRSTGSYWGPEEVDKHHVAERYALLITS